MDARTVKLEGRSGCPIRIFESGSTVIFRKTSASIAYNKRLKIQRDKQQDYCRTGNTDSSFYAPGIMQSGLDESGLFYMDMEYVRGDKFSDYFSKITVAQINSIVSSIQDFINKDLGACDSKILSPEIIQNKVTELREKLQEDLNFTDALKTRVFDYLTKEIPDIPIPIGVCHGDLTFSNMLFSASNRIYLFDFLDSFIESPLIDLVKIRQDTRFHWSVEIDDQLEGYKKAKVLQILNYIDGKISAFIESFGTGFRIWYNYLEVFNLVRIMPYVTAAKDISFLNKNLNILIPIK